MPMPVRIAAPLLILLVSASAAIATPRVTVPPPVDQALYPPTQGGFEHFVQDTLGALIASRAWTWDGRDFDGRRLHAVPRVRVEQVPVKIGRGYGSAMRGYVIAVVHVAIDGRLHRARVIGNAGYDADPSGWRWEQVLLHLGGGEQYDFASGEIR